MRYLNSHFLLFKSGGNSANLVDKGCTELCREGCEFMFSCNIPKFFNFLAKVLESGILIEIGTGISGEFDKWLKPFL